MKLSKYFNKTNLPDVIGWYATWYLVGLLIINFILVSQVWMASIEVHWSQLILISILVPIIPVAIVCKLFIQEKDTACQS